VFGEKEIGITTVKEMKLMDLHDVIALMYFLRFGRHKPGSASKQVTREQKLSVNFRWSPTIYYYIPDLS
jgi:hypothetical protein